MKPLVLNRVADDFYIIYIHVSISEAGGAILQLREDHLYSEEYALALVLLSLGANFL